MVHAAAHAVDHSGDNHSQPTVRHPLQGSLTAAILSLDSTVIKGSVSPHTEHWMNQSLIKVVLIKTAQKEQGFDNIKVITVELTELCCTAAEC